MLKKLMRTKSILSKSTDTTDSNDVLLNATPRAWTKQGCLPDNNRSSDGLSGLIHGSGKLFPPKSDLNYRPEPAACMPGQIVPDMHPQPAAHATGTDWTLLKGVGPAGHDDGLHGSALELEVEHAEIEEGPASDAWDSDGPDASAAADDGGNNEPAQPTADWDGPGPADCDGSVRGRIGADDQADEDDAGGGAEPLPGCFAQAVDELISRFNISLGCETGGTEEMEGAAGDTPGADGAGGGGGGASVDLLRRLTAVRLSARAVIGGGQRPICTSDPWHLGCRLFLTLRLSLSSSLPPTGHGRDRRCRRNHSGH
jgi:hypothetical protein